MAQADRFWDWSALRARCLTEARTLLDSPAEVEDVVQDALVRAWRMQHQCRDRGQPGPWAAQITRNEVFRHRSRRVVTWTLEAADGVPDAGAAAALERIEMLFVRQALAQLSDADRTLVRLRYEEDLTQLGIAEVLGIPEGTVKVRLHRVRTTLRRLIDAEATR